MISKISVQYVNYMPKELESGVLYVSKEFGTAAHLCACGCGTKIRTPLSPTDWSFKETKEGPSLFPSIGNWQQTCQSHYWICKGKIKWSDKWTPEQIAAGRQYENERNRNYFEALEHKNSGALQKLWRWIKNLSN